jgi:hypothetical protein
MRKFYRLTLLILAAVMSSQLAFGQYASEYTGGLKVKLNESGSKYIRFITWHQMWSTTDLSDSSDPDFSPSTEFRLRRSRFLAFAQINKRFLILTHFGLNNLSPALMGTASPSGGNGGNGVFFMHDAWVEYTVLPKFLYIGGGLHYWNGISRLSNQSTLNFMTLDAPGHNWANIGITDQFARHLGFYAKGMLGRFEYRVAVNQAIQNNSAGLAGRVEGLALSERRFVEEETVDVLKGFKPGGLPDFEAEFVEGDSVDIFTGYRTDRAVYRNPNNLGGGLVFNGYFNYQFLDQESNVLPYYVGTYLGAKRVLNVGAGFFYHQDGASFFESDAVTAEPTVVSPVTFSADVFYDAPLGGSGMALAAYASFTNHNWGPNFAGDVPGVNGALGGAGTGNIIYGQVGLALPEISEQAGRFQPYLHFTQRDLEATEGFAAQSNQLGIGLNWYEAGHNSKITLEYQRNQAAAETGDPTVTSFLRLQMVIFL